MPAQDTVPAKSDADRFAELERARKKLKNSGHDNLYTSVVSPDGMTKILLDEHFEYNTHESCELQNKQLVLIERKRKQ